MDRAPKKIRSPKEQLQLDRARWFTALQKAVVDQQTALTLVTFFVVWTLVTRFHNDKCGAFPSHQTLAAATGLGVKAVRVHLDIAVAAGFLSKRRVGCMQPNVYFVNYAVVRDRDDRTAETHHSSFVIGPTALVTSSEMPMKTGDRTEIAVSRAGTEDSLPVQVIGLAEPTDRARRSLVIGPENPANHLEDNQREEPRQTLVRSPFGRSDDLGRKALIEDLTHRVFQETHGKGRERSRKAGIARALRELANDGVDLEAAVRGTIACMHGDDAYNDELGGHAAAEKILSTRRFEGWLDDDQQSLGGTILEGPEDDWTAFF